MEINTSGIKKDADNIMSSIGELKTEYNNIVRSVTSMKSAWIGGSADDFFKTLETEYLKELKDSIDALTNYYYFLNKVPEAYEMLDKCYGNKKIDV